MHFVTICPEIHQFVATVWPPASTLTLMLDFRAKGHEVLVKRISFQNILLASTSGPFALKSINLQRPYGRPHHLPA